MTVEIRALERADDRQAFHSGDEALDLYFHKYAGQNPFRHHVGVTYVVVEGGRVLGFATVSPGSLDAGDLPSGRRAPLLTPCPFSASLGSPSMNPLASSVLESTPSLRH